MTLCTYVFALLHIYLSLLFIIELCPNVLDCRIYADINCKRVVNFL